MMLVSHWLSSLSMVISRSIHVAANAIIYFLLFYLFFAFLFIFIFFLSSSLNCNQLLFPQYSIFFSTVQHDDPVTHTCMHSFLTLSCLFNFCFFCRGMLVPSLCVCVCMYWVIVITEGGNLC